MSGILFVEAVNGVLINAKTIMRVVIEDGETPRYFAIDKSGFRWRMDESQYRKLRHAGASRQMNRRLAAEVAQ